MHWIICLKCFISAGKCFCLYQEDTSLPAESVPHILESDITSTVLFLKRMEIAGLNHCDFIDRPGEIQFSYDLSILFKFQSSLLKHSTILRHIYSCYVVTSKSKESTSKSLDMAWDPSFFAPLIKYCVIYVATLILNSECMYIFSQIEDNHIKLFIESLTWIWAVHLHTNKLFTIRCLQ